MKDRPQQLHTIGLQRKVRDSLDILARYCEKSSRERNGVDVAKQPRGHFKQFLDDAGVARDKHTRQHFKQTLAKIRRHGFRTVHAAAQARKGVARQRMLGSQGKHQVKGKGLKEALFAWFCQIRGAIAGRLPLDILYAKAEELRLDFIKEALAKSIKPDVPKFLRTGWMCKFMKAYHISLRRPNKRWKVPRKTLLVRLRTMWCNSLRIRVLCWLAHGYDPRASGFDQKPFHINESGSKEAKTLSFKGQKEVALKELHGDTRARWTACTMVVSDPAQARAGPHLECLFKGGAGILATLEAAAAGLAPADAPARLTVQVSDSGSYRMEHVLTYLDRALARRPGEPHDWRILYCDVYAAHLGDPVSRLAWSHNYVMVIHGGGTTGVAQVNDTHLHQALSREYQRLEQQDLYRELARRPSSCPTRQRGVCMRDLHLIWQREEIHLAAAEGFQRNMLTNAVDGSEDSRASVEIARFWEELGMNSIRTEVVENMCEEWEQGRLEWSYEVVYGLIEEHAKSGILDVYVEGQEDEGEDADEPQPWDDGDGGDDDCDARQRSSEDLVPIAGLTEAQEEELAFQDRRLSILDSTMDLADGEFPSLVRHARDLRDEVVKQSTVGSEADAGVARAVRAKERARTEAAIQDRMRSDEEAKKRRVHAEAVESSIALFERKSLELHEREKKLQEATARRRVAEDVAARRQAIEDADMFFSANDMGQGRANPGSDFYKQTRLKMLAKVFRLGEEMPAEMAANWKIWSQRFDQMGCQEHKASWGSTFRDMMIGLMDELRAGDMGACMRFHARYTIKWCLTFGEVRVPGHL